MLTFLKRTVCTTACVTTACVTTATLALLPTQAFAQVPEQPAWACLPPETVATLRSPNGMAYIEALKTQTKLGQLFLSKERIDKAIDLFKQEAGEDWDEVADKLKEFGVEPADFIELAKGNLGMAVVPVERQSEAMQDEGPLFVLIAWVDTNTDLADRFSVAFDKASAMSLEEVEGTQRVDIDLNGQTAILMSMPKMGYAGLYAWEVEDFDHETWDHEAQNTSEQVDQSHLLYTRVGDRLVMAMVPPQSGDTIRHMMADEQAIDWAELTGSQELIGTIARFTQAHSNPLDESFASRMLAETGLQQAVPEGVVGMVAHIDPRPLMDWFLADEMGPMEAEIIQALGIQDAKPMALGLTQDGQVMRTNVVVGMPWPRHGLWDLLTQPHLAPEPDAWVPADVQEYAQFTWDWSAFYEKAKNIAMAVAPDEAEMQIAQMEAGFQMFTGAQLTDLLDTIGDKISYIRYPEVMVDVEEVDWEQDFDYNTDRSEWPTTTVTMPIPRFAVVFNLSDNTIWQTILQAVKPMMGVDVNPGFQSLDAQGFVGIQGTDAPREMAVAIGDQHLVISYGPDVLSRVLSALNNPPAPEHQLINSERFAQANMILPPKPSMIWNLIDLEIVTSNALDMLSEAMLMHGEADPAVQMFLELMPSPEELQGVMQTGVQQWVVTEDGLVVESATLLAPAE